MAKYRYTLLPNQTIKLTPTKGSYLTAIAGMVISAGSFVGLVYWAKKQEAELDRIYEDLHD